MGDLTKRTFVYDGREFPDPDPTLSADDVRKSMAAFYPELAMAEIKEHKKEDGVQYELVRKTGTKSYLDNLTSHMLVAGLKLVPETHLDLIDIANACSKNGKLDDTLVSLHRADVDIAVDKCAAYIRGVRHANARLKNFIEQPAKARR